MNHNCDHQDGPRVAWSVEIDNMRCVVFAATKPKARWIAVKSYWEAYGRRRGEWPSANAWRADQFDKSFRRNDPRQKAWSEDDL